MVVVTENCPVTERLLNRKHSAGNLKLLPGNVIPVATD